MSASVMVAGAALLVAWQSQAEAAEQVELSKMPRGARAPGWRITGTRLCAPATVCSMADRGTRHGG